jgi:CRP/FNR family transcriptional regulator
LSASGKETILGFIGPGEFFGEVALLSGNVAPFNALALQRTALLVLRKAEFYALLKDPGTCRSMISVMSSRCNDAWAQIEALGSGFLEEKLRVMLSWLGSRLGVRTSKGIEIRMNQRQLAQMVGVSRESLNRQLSTLKEEGVIEVCREQRPCSILITAPGKLTPMA